MTHRAIVAVFACLAVGGSMPTRAAQQPACSPDGGLNFICDVQAPEDLVLIPNTRWLIASGMAAGSRARLRIAEGIAEKIASRRFALSGWPARVPWSRNRSDQTNPVRRGVSV